jgi:hypothetical protein
MAVNAPEDSAYVGPADPTGNPWLPPELMIMGIPIALLRNISRKPCYDKAISINRHKSNRWLNAHVEALFTAG